MKCPGCGYESFDLLETCRRCGAPMAAARRVGRPRPRRRRRSVRPGSAGSGPGPRRSRTHGSRRRSRRTSSRCSTTTRSRSARTISTRAGRRLGAGEDDGPRFASTTISSPGRPRRPRRPAAARIRADRDERTAPGGRAADLPGPAFALAGEERRRRGGRRADHRPRRRSPRALSGRRRSPASVGGRWRCWSIRRCCWRLLGVFFLGALLALRLNGFDADAAPGRRRPAGVGRCPSRCSPRCSVSPTRVFFHGSTGRTPGKALRRHRSPDRRRRVPDLGPGAPALARRGPRPGVRRRRHRLGALRAAASRLGRPALGNGGRPARRSAASCAGEAVAPLAVRLTIPGGRGYHASAVVGRDSSAGRATD